MMIRCIALILLLAGCGQTGDRAAAVQSEGAMTEAVSQGAGATRPRGDLLADGGGSRLPEGAELAGRWPGPEGLFADIQPDEAGAYTVRMQYDLDHAATFEARRAGDALVLEGRPDGPVRLVRGSGAESGMKWMDPAADCLIARVGSEAYCRPRR